MRRPVGCARLSVEADNALDATVHAAHVALELAGKAGLPSWPVVRVELFREDVLERELDRPNFPEIVGSTEAGELLGVSRQRVH